MKKIALSLLMFLFIYGVSADPVLRPPLPVREKFVPAENATAGGAIEAKLEITIDKGWHIFSEKPEVEGIKATRVSLEPSDAFSVTKISFPNPQVMRSPIFQKDLSLYQDKVMISILLQLNQQVARDILIKGALEFQACSDTLCLPPSKHVFLGVQVVR